MPSNIPGDFANEEQLAEAIRLMRVAGVDTQHVEVKSAKRELTKDLPRTVSAFSNGSGGVIICGISEKDGFTPVKGFNASSIQDAIAQTCSEKLQPPVRPDVRIMLFENSPVVVAYIPEMRPMDKPCYVKASDRYQGSYIRTGDGDMRLSSYEVDRLVDEHQQPKYDIRVVLEATMDDLDETLVKGLLTRERDVHGRNFAKLSDEKALIRLGAAALDGQGTLRPTLAGLLALGEYPQQFYPRLNVSFACYPGTRKGEVGPGHQRLVDSGTMVGPIPSMVQDALAAVSRNTRKGAIIEGAFRKDVPDYPPVALREAIVNALMHRDYSPESLGTPVQLDLYVDRLEIINPGGLYGSVTTRTLGSLGVTSSRNQYLSNLLEHTPYGDGSYVAENRGTGYMVIESELEAALMPEPVPKDSIATFSLVFERRRVTASEATLSAREQVRTTVLSLLENGGSISTTEVVQKTGRSRATVYKYIREMVEEKVIEPTEPRKSTKQRYRMRTS
jgi:ATP-dependent DNA helicase RecG